MYVANVAENGFTNNPHLDAVRQLAASENSEVVAVCASIEAEIAQLEEADRAEFLKDIGLDEPGLNRVIRAGYKLLGLQTYFTVGPKETRAWTVRIGSTAPQAAGVIHTSKKDSSAPRSSRMTTTSPIKANRVRRKWASCDWKARNTSSTKAM